MDADVAVIGGGIVGITTALLLQEAGARVVLLEAGRLAGGVSGYTTAKVSSQHGMIYDRLRSELRRRRARAPTAPPTRRRSRGWPSRVERDGIDCDFRRRASYAYVGPDADRADAEREAEAALAAGLPASLVERDAAALPRRGRRALRRPGGVPRPQVPARARRAARRGLRALPRRPGRRRRALHGQDAGRQRHRRPRRGRDALPLPRPRARLRARVPAALLRAPVPDRGRAAGGHVHQRRLAHPLGPRRPARRRGAAAGRRRGPQDRRGRRHRGALPRARALRPRALGRASRSSTAGPRRTARRSTACPTSGRSRRATSRC